MLFEVFVQRYRFNVYNVDYINAFVVENFSIVLQWKLLRFCNSGRYVWE